MSEAEEAGPEACPVGRGWGDHRLDRPPDWPYDSTTVKTSRRIYGRGALAGLLLCLLAAASAGCSRSPVEKAVAGGFDAEKNNKIITAYCTSCHAHKDFKPEPHLAVAPTIYQEKPYQGATECRICHGVDLKGWAIPWVQRKTHRPHGPMIPLAKRAIPPELPQVK